MTTIICYMAPSSYAAVCGGEIVVNVVVTGVTKNARAVT